MKNDREKGGGKTRFRSPGILKQLNHGGTMRLDYSSTLKNSLRGFQQGWDIDKAVIRMEVKYLTSRSILETWS